MIMLMSDTQKLKIYSKKLSSGKSQVKFFLTSRRGKSYYGYMLVEKGRSIRNVMETILHKLEDIDCPDRYYHRHLYHVGDKSNFDPSFLLFNNPGLVSFSTGDPVSFKH